MTRPRVTLKLATSLDGRIATASGESKWITGELAREQVHRLRAMHQMILVGVDTAIADDPELTVRLPGFVGGQPTRVVLDSRQRLPTTAKLVATAERIDTVVVTVSEPADRLVEAGVTVLRVAEKDGRPDLAAALDALAMHQRERLRARVVQVRDEAAFDKLLSLTGGVLIEGGGQVAASFIEAGLVDAVEWFRAPIVLGDEGRPAIGGFVLKELSGAPRFRRVAVEALGDDLWERYERV
ncbi:RibD family protein [Caulobacter sp. 17J80-11]|uniref:RibD family protein n=1 Tax=Caulobacter sp. 17J80-11 TaxID=2763502 RepID=UPI001653DC1D|nr:RibD family protein [Caulobacter sp. 17J80-11]MBC6980826.1 RibD family protein [Caulobacter sp. 17J80-11]